jgi:aspartyl-tRNA(Asn)/glutamyl-tRNA(Gln) amidotransferase subunit A
VKPIPSAHPSARQTADDIRTGRRSAVEVVKATLETIASTDARLHAFLTVSGERALDTAARVDADRARGAGLDRPLLGVPIAVKDNLCTAGVRTTAASRVLADYVPPYSATVVTRLEEAGAIIIGKTNLDEFSMGSSTEHSAVGATRNPWDESRTPGGSSGGSAAAVAAGLVPAALGSDTGGSIRQPAAFCGLVGLKPTYGRVSRYGLIAFASSLDQVGPMTRTTADAALLLEAIAGHDPHDATSSPEPVPDLRTAMGRGVTGLRIGVPRDLLREGVDTGVLQGFESALARWTDAGAVLVDITLPHTAHAVPVYYLIATAEASSNLSRYDGVRYGVRAPLTREQGLRDAYALTRAQGFGDEVKRRIMLGTYVLSHGYYDAYYLKAQQVRTLLRRDYDTAFGRCDVVAMPTTPSPAYRLGEKTGSPLQMYLEDIFTVSANLTGLPAVSAPAGLTPDGLPVGVQLMGRMFDEGTLLAAAQVLED